MIFAASRTPGWLHEVQLKNGILYLFAQAVPAFTAVFTLAFYTRWLPPEDFGVYSLVVVIATAANIILFNWLYVGVYRFWNDGHLSQNDLRAVVVFALNSVSGLTLLLAAVTALWSRQYEVIVAFSALLLCGAFFTANQRINAITNQAGQFLWAETFRVVIASAIGVSLVWAGYSWPGIISGTCIGFILASLFSRQFRQLFATKPERPGLQIFKQLLVYGLPLSLTFVLLEIIHASDRVLLTLLVGVEAAGQYAAAISLPQQLLVMIASAVGLALYPQIIRSLEEEGEEKASTLLGRYLLILLGLLLPAWLGLVAIREDFIPLILGPDFVFTAIRLLPWLGLAMVLNSLYLFYVSYAFQLSRDTAATVRIVIAAAVLNAILNAALIPVLEELGAALATITAYAICVFYGFWRGCRLFPMLVDWSAVIKILLSAFLMFAILEFLPMENGWFRGVIRSVLGVVLYSSFVLGMNIGNVRHSICQHCKILLGGLCRN